MRGTRWLLLVAIAVIIGGVVTTYRAQKSVLKHQAPPRPAELPLHLNSSAEDWHWSQTENGRTAVEITAKDFQQVKDSSRVDLRGVELKLYHKQDPNYDLVKSAAASFSADDKKLFSDGEVEITLAVPKDGPPAHRLVSIKTSGVAFDSATGRADTDRPSSFVFEDGEGKCVGATYDPSTHQLQMKSQAEVIWRGHGPKPRPMKIEAGELLYHEAHSEVWLQPWSRLTRENSIIEGGMAIVRLDNKTIRQIEAKTAHGVENDPKRKLEYSADNVLVDMNDDGEVQKIGADNNARIVSTTAASETTMTGHRVELQFAPGEGGSILTNAAGMGDCLVVSKPLAAPGKPLPETHQLRADALRLIMREGGREIAEVATDAPGTVEFLPNLPTQHHRRLEGERMYIYYGPQNRIQSFRSVKSTTHTDPTPEELKRNRVASVTRSVNLLAKFDPQTGKLATMEQWDDFSYEEGERKARAARASMDSEQNVITLDTAARMWDSTGSTSADRIRMDQKSGFFLAEGRVNSSRMPDKKKQASEMLSGDDPVQATAKKMTSADRNQRVHYEGGVTMWQGANRIQADTIDLDRQKHTLIADGHVVTNLWEQPQDPAKAPAGNTVTKGAPAVAGIAAKPAPGTAGPAAAAGTPPGAGTGAKKGSQRTPAQPKPATNPVLTVVHAQHLVYTEQDRLADYTGGVLLTRPSLRVKAAELRAFLAESGSDSRLDKAYADGHVEIVQTAPDRTRTGTAEHAEYFTADQKVILRGGNPQMIDTLRGNTHGAELTYFANDDRLLVNGAPDKPVSTRITHKK